MLGWQSSGCAIASARRAPTLPRPRPITTRARPPPQAHPRDAVSVPAFLVIDSPGSPGEFAKWLACKVSL